MITKYELKVDYGDTNTCISKSVERLEFKDKFNRKLALVVADNMLLFNIDPTESNQSPWVLTLDDVDELLPYIENFSEVGRLRGEH